MITIKRVRGPIMNKAELIERLSDRTQMSRKDVERLLDAFEQTIIEALKEGKEATLTGFGTFLPRRRDARMGVNPRNPKERIHIPTVIVPKFKAGKTLKDALKTSKRDDTANK